MLPTFRSYKLPLVFLKAESPQLHRSTVPTGPEEAAMFTLFPLPRFLLETEIYIEAYITTRQATH
jgi:hypothetical protein